MRNLIEQRRKYEEELNNGQEYIKADRSGAMSYKIDGLEEVLTPEKFDNINEEMLSSYNLKTGQMISTSKEEGKIVNNYECYVVVYLKSDEAKDAAVGSTIVTLRLSDKEEVTGELAYKREENNKIMLVFRINKNVEELIAYRKISLDIVWWSYSGLKVPNVALVEEDDLTYVIRNRTGYNDKILVKVKKQNQNYSIITNYTSEELKELGWTQDEIAARKVISLYDEVSINKNRKK